MEKKTLYAFGALLLLTVVAVVSLTRPEKGERVGERPRPVAEIKPGTIATLELSQPGNTDKVTLGKNGEKWQVTAPYNQPADGMAVKAAVEGLEKVKWGDVTTQKQDQWKEMEVSDDKGVHVVAKDSAGKVLADLYVGKLTGTSTMVRVAGKDDVYQVTDMSAYLFKKEGKTWREHTIFDLKADEAEKVMLTGAGTSVTLERLPPPKGPDGKEGGSSIYDAKWKVVAGDDKSLKPDAVGPVDDGLVNGVAQGIASLHAAEFVDDGKPAELGLAPGAPGQVEIKVWFKGGKTAGLRVGALKGDDYQVQTLDAPQIFTVKKFTLERMAHIPQDVRDKSIVKLKEDQLDQITIQQGQQGTDTLVLKHADKAWKLDKGESDETKAKGVADSFDALSGSSFIAPGAPEIAALAKPRATVTLKPKTGAPVVLKIGEVKGEEVPVQKAGQDPMWVKKYQVDRFLKKPADLAKDKK